MSENCDNRFLLSKLASDYLFACPQRRAANSSAENRWVYKFNQTWSFFVSFLEQSELQINFKTESLEGATQYKTILGWRSSCCIGVRSLKSRRAFWAGFELKFGKIWDLVSALGFRLLIKTSSKYS